LDAPGRASVASAIVVAALARTAAAEGDRALSLGLGWATWSAPGKKVGSMAPPALSPDGGVALSVAYEHAIGTDVALRGQLVGSAFSGGAQKGESNTSYAALAAAGAEVRFDVLRHVPYAFAEVGGVVSGGGPIARGAEFVLAIGGGVDWLASRSRSLGGELTIASFGGDVTVVTIGVRGSVRWGYF
jgi:hypothetical protein